MYSISESVYIKSKLVTEHKCYIYTLYVSILKIEDTLSSNDIVYVGAPVCLILHLELGAVKV